MGSTARLIVPRSEPATPPPPKPAPLPAAPSLPYEVEQPWYGQRRAFRIIVLLLLLNIIAVTSITWGPINVRAWQDHRAAAKAAEAKAKADAALAAAERSAIVARAAAVKAALAFQMPAGQVIYTEDPGEASRLLFAPEGGYSAVSQVSGTKAVMPPPPVLATGSAEMRRALNAFAANPSEGTLFLHGRTNPGGQSRIVCVQVVAARTVQVGNDDSGTRFIFLGSQRQLRAFVVSPTARLWMGEVAIEQPDSRRGEVPVPSDSGDTRWTPHTARPGEVLRLLSGRADPSDPARLLIDYTLDGKPGTLAMTLQNDDRLRFDADRGTATIERFDARNGRVVWKP
jgi:hypothetical protein